MALAVASVVFGTSGVALSATKPPAAHGTASPSPSPTISPTGTPSPAPPPVASSRPEWYEGGWAALIALIWAVAGFNAVKVAGPSVQEWIRSRAPQPGPDDAPPPARLTYRRIDEGNACAGPASVGDLKKAQAAIATLKTAGNGTLNLSLAAPLDPQVTMTAFADALKDLDAYCIAAYAHMMGSQFTLLRRLSLRTLQSESARAEYETAVANGCSLDFMEWLSFFERFTLIDLATSHSYESVSISLSEHGEAFIAWCDANGKSEQSLRIEGRGV